MAEDKRTAAEHHGKVFTTGTGRKVVKLGTLKPPTTRKVN